MQLYVLTESYSYSETQVLAFIKSHAVLCELETLTMRPWDCGA
jgi:hypothetical protein